MGIDLKALDEKIKKLQLVRQLAADPELAAILQSVVTKNGTTPSESEKQGGRWEVLKFVPESSEIGEYCTSREIMDKMIAAGHKFKAKEPMSTVREHLRELEEEDLIERAGTKEDGAVLWRKK